MKDPRVQSNPAYLSVILLSRVVTGIGSLKMVNPKVIEGLFAADFSFLQEMYTRINQNGSNVIRTTCPKCEHKFEIEAQNPGE